MENIFDTIVAIATPFAFSSVGIIRISGDSALDIASLIFDREIKPKMINYGHIKNDNGEEIDEVILLPFIAPKSYTGENVVEIQTHGNPAILNEVLELVLSHGARMAQRGEFTKRAFLNHRIDLTQAEAVLDIVQSKTAKSAQKALYNLEGYLSREIALIKEDLVKIYSKIIASIDFPEDVKSADTKDIVSICSDNILKINNILKNSKSHDFIRDGINIALIGRPNAGKSSLFNALLNYSRAIVTPIEGTTRDTIKETVNLGGYALNFIDTAGIRDKSKADFVEKIGIENSIEAIRQSQIVLFLFEESKDEIENELLNELKDKKILFVKTKKDINPAPPPEKSIAISSVTGENIELLREKIVSLLKELVVDDFSYTTNKRQQTCLERARESLENVLNTAGGLDMSELFAIDIKDAILALDEISGEVLTDKILENIFDNFCIGK